MSFSGQGGTVTGGHNVSYTVSADANAVDYSISISSNSANTANMLPETTDNSNNINIVPTTGTCENPATSLEQDLSFGYKLGSATVGVICGTNGYIGLNNSDNQTTIVQQVTESSVSETIGVEWAARIDNPASIRAGKYSVEVLYTITANEQAAVPRLTGFVVNDSYYQGLTKDFAVKGKNLQSMVSSNAIYFVKAGSNPNVDSNRHYASKQQLNCDTSGCTVSFVNPVLNDIGDYDVYVETADGVAALKNGFHIIARSNCINGNDGSLCRVDMDDNMIPIRFAGNTYETVNGVANVPVAHWVKADVNTEGDWYNYNQKQWANVVTIATDKLSAYKDAAPGTEINNDDVLSYFVYIPRYAYEVQRRDATDHYVPDKITVNGSVIKNEFAIRYETVDTAKSSPAVCAINSQIQTAAQMWKDGTLNNGTDSNILAKDYRTGCGISRDYADKNSSTWATHPAFTFGDKELNGIWVSKHELTGTTKQPTAKPNQKHINFDSMGIMYDIAKSMGTLDAANVYGSGTVVTQNNQNLTDDGGYTSHMVKNVEYGAVVYLSSSADGAGINGVQPNTNNQSGKDASGKDSRSVTGCGPASATSKSTYTDGTDLSDKLTSSLTACSNNNPERAWNGSIGVLASTTNNVYGVYDMAGFSFGLVMGSSTMDSLQTDGGQFNTPAREPYVNLYRLSDGFGFTSDEPGNIRAWSRAKKGTFDASNNDVCTWETCGGQALHETKAVQSVTGDGQSWGADGGRMVFSNRWMGRGGFTDSSDFAGLYAHYTYGGTGRANSGTRAVIISMQ
ncbi:MAG: hypothetical protein Q4C83_02920 [Candidatus Saccharibacteria bacterium]|nr:hypothetical protein [Candidatus Saccharibacteria bacterium]